MWQARYGGSGQLLGLIVVVTSVAGAATGDDRCGAIVAGRVSTVQVTTVGGVPVVIDSAGRARVFASVAVPVGYPLGGYSAVVSGYAPHRETAGDESRADVRADGDAGDRGVASNEPRWASVLRTRCATCHRGENETGTTLWDEDGKTLSATLDDAAVLYQVITDRMPKGGELTVEEKAILVSWLRERAKERN